jgi:hypothetical protein
MRPSAHRGPCSRRPPLAAARRLGPRIRAASGPRHANGVADASNLAEASGCSLHILVEIGQWMVTVLYPLCLRNELALYLFRKLNGLVTKIIVLAPDEYTISVLILKNRFLIMFVRMAGDATPTDRPIEADPWKVRSTA